jgi:hypothetical protein
MCVVSVCCDCCLFPFVAGTLSTLSQPVFFSFFSCLMRFALALVVLAALAYAQQQSIVQTAQATPTLSTLVDVLTRAAYAPVLNTLSGNGHHSLPSCFVSFSASFLYFSFLAFLSRLPSLTLLFIFILFPYLSFRSVPSLAFLCFPTLLLFLSPFII